MKILQVCHKPPLPAIDGGCIAMHAITTGLQQAGHQVKVMALATHKHPYRPDLLSEAYKIETNLEIVPADTELKPIPALRSLLQGRSYNLDRFDVPEFRERVVKALKAEHFDAVVLESLFATPVLPDIRKHFSGPVVLRAHNTEYRIWESLAGNTRNAIKRQYLLTLTRQLKEAEVAISKGVDGIAFIAAADREEYLEWNPQLQSEVIPLAIDLGKVTAYPNNAEEKPKLLYLGALDWEPNREGLSEFFTYSWPLVRKAIPEVELILAGRNAPAGFADELPEGVQFLGEVESPAEVMAHSGLVLVPLRSGSGMRVKVLEAMAWAKPVIATATGMQGIGAEDGQQCLIALTPEEFAEKVIFGLQNPRKMAEMGQLARTWVEAHFELAPITERLVSLFRQLAGE